MRRGSRGGQGLIAHELTHMFQQRGEIVQRMISYQTENVDSDGEDELARGEFKLTPPTEETNVQNKKESKDGGYVILWRGTGYNEIEKMVEASSAGGKSANANVGVPTQGQVKEQVQKAKGDKIEFSSQEGIAEGFSYKNGGLAVVKIHTKYLIKGSVSEGGWVCDPSAPVEVLETVDRRGTTDQTRRINAG